MIPGSEVFSALRWWAAIMLIGLAAAPLTFTLLQRLPDRGYAFSKFVGLLLISFFFWLLNVLGFLDNDAGGLLFTLLLVVALSLGASRIETAGALETQDGRRSWRGWMSDNWRYVLFTELLFASAFAFWVWVRSQNPQISATEKPMEFAFLNSASRSPNYPPLDPWLSGFAISYYYFGYVMTSVITRLAAVPEYIGFNLAVAWLAAGTALGAFGLVYNLVAAGGRAARQRALLLGLVASLAIPLAGNMEIMLEVLHANGVGADGIWEWLDVRDLEAPAVNTETPRYTTPTWWWWRSSRVIHEYHLSGRPETGLEPIAEFPAFSFILGDLHPHVLALPFAFLSLATALVWWLRPPIDLPDLRFWRTRSFARDELRRLASDDWRLVVFTALILGGLSFLNTWDVLIHLFIVLGAYTLSGWREQGRWTNRLLGRTFFLAVLLVIPAILLYFPFYLGFRSQAGPPFLLPMTMRPTRLAHFLIIFGLPLFAISIFLTALFSRHARLPNGEIRPWKTALLVVSGLVLFLFILMLLLGWVISVNLDGAARIIALAEELNLQLPTLPADASPYFRVRWGAAAMAILVPSFLKARLLYPWQTLFVAGLLVLCIGLLIRRLSCNNTPGESARQPEDPGSLPFILLLIGTAAMLTLGPEFVYLKDVFSQRLNTIFKFYFQAWILFGSAALFALDYLWRRFRLAGLLTVAVYGMFLLIALLFPFFAVQTRAAEYRGAASAEIREPPTLNGLAYLKRFSPADYEAIMWLRENVTGTPVIVEAVGGQYSDYGRVSAATGLPTLLGWAGHEFQWRGSTPEPGEREPAVGKIFGDADWSATAEILNRYHVDYVYLGALERTTYNQGASEKFEQNLEVVFENGGVTIYRWQPE